MPARASASWCLARCARTTPPRNLSKSLRAVAEYAGIPAKNVTGRRIGAAFIDLALYSALCFGLFFMMAESSDGAVLLDATNIHFQLGDTTWFVEGGEAGLVYLLDFGGAEAPSPTRVIGQPR